MCYSSGLKKAPRSRPPQLALTGPKTSRKALEFYRAAAICAADWLGVVIRPASCHFPAQNSTKICHYLTI
jgi:hypothetical protein